MQIPYLYNCMQNESFIITEKLKKRKSIEQLFCKGESINYYPFKLIFSMSEGEVDNIYPAQVAFVVPKRLFKKAVDRNSLKRKMREAFRKNKKELNQILISKNKKVEFIILYVTSEKNDYRLIEKKMLGLLEALCRACQKR